MKSSLLCQLLRMMMRETTVFSMNYWAGPYVTHTPLVLSSLLTATLGETLLALSHRPEYSTPNVKQLGNSHSLGGRAIIISTKCGF